MIFLPSLHCYACATVPVVVTLICRVCSAVVFSASAPVFLCLQCWSGLHVPMGFSCLAVRIDAMFGLRCCELSQQCPFCCASVYVVMFCLLCAVALPTLCSCMVMLLSVAGPPGLYGYASRCVVFK